MLKSEIDLTARLERSALNNQQHIHQKDACGGLRKGAAEEAARRRRHENERGA